MSEMPLLARFRTVKLFKLDSGVMSEMLLPPSHSELRLVRYDSTDTSEIEFSKRFRTVKLFKSDSGERSEMLLYPRFSHFRLVKPDSGERSEMLLLLRRKPSTVIKPRFKLFRLIANSRPVKSVIFAFRATRRVRVDISPLVIVSSLALPRLSAMTARKLASGMETIPSSPPRSDSGISLPKLSLKTRKSGIPITPLPSRSYLASYLPSPRIDPKRSINSKKSGTPTTPSPSKSGERAALNEIIFVVVTSSIDDTLSASLTALMPRENFLPVTSDTVINSARARKPDDGKVTGVTVPKFMMPADSGTININTLFSAFSNFKTEASKSNSIYTPTTAVVTPLTNTSTAIFVPCPDTVPEVTLSSLWLPAPPSAIRSIVTVALALEPAVASPVNTSRARTTKNNNLFFKNICNLPKQSNVIPGTINIITCLLFYNIKDLDLCKWAK